MSSTLPPSSTDSKTPAPSRRTGEYWSPPTGERRWYSIFEKEMLIEGVKKFLWVGPLTLLIWIYAEREQIQTLTGIEVPIQVYSSDRNKVVSLRGIEKVYLDLKGPQATLERVREKITGGIPRGIELEVGSTLAPAPNQTLNVIERIQNLADFKDNGVTITKCDPPGLIVDVDSMVERELEVKLPPGVDNVSTAVFEPRRIKARGPGTLLSKEAQAGRLLAYADVATLDILRAPGHHELATVPVISPVKDERVTLVPAVVKASLDVRATDVAGTIAAAPVTVQCPPGLLKDFDVSVQDPSVRNIHVMGPQDKIDRLMLTPPRAILEITSDDVGKGQQSRAVKFDLPPDVKVSAEDQNRTVEFQLMQR